MWILVFQRMLLEFVLDVLYFPIWWYADGAKQALIKCVYLWQDASMYLAPGLWLRNIFVPMFGQRDWQGRITSFLVRAANVVVRGVMLLIWTLIVLAIWLAWLFVPAFVVYMSLKSAV